jgi:hypothetical protein
MAASRRSRASSSSSVSSRHSSRSAVSAASPPSGNGLGRAANRVTASSSSVGCVPSRNTLRTEKSAASYPAGTGDPGSTTAPPRGSSTSNSRSAQFAVRSWCGATRCSTTR